MQARPGPLTGMGSGQDPGPLANLQTQVPPLARQAGHPVPVQPVAHAQQLPANPELPLQPTAKDPAAGTGQGGYQAGAGPSTPRS